MCIPIMFSFTSVKYQTVSFGFREISKHFLSCSHNQRKKGSHSFNNNNNLCCLKLFSHASHTISPRSESHVVCDWLKSQAMFAMWRAALMASQQHTQGVLLEKPRNWGMDQEVSKRGRVSCYMSSIQFLEGEWGEQPCWNPTESEDFHCGRHHS